MVEDGEDWHGLRKTSLEKFRLNFSKCTNRKGTILVLPKFLNILKRPFFTFSGFLKNM